MDTDLRGYDGAGRHPLPDPVAFAARMAALGFDDASDIVVYDDAGGTIAARLWWMLGQPGAPARVRARRRARDVVRGRWPDDRRRAVAGPVPVAARLLVAHHRPRGRSSGGWARSGCSTRGPASGYRGELEPVDPVPGHIPTAVNKPTASNLDVRDGFPATDRAARALAGDGETIVSCGSGVTGCHLALAMRVAGLPDPVLYPGSYSDWSRSGLPVATGDAPGDVPAELR